MHMQKWLFFRGCYCGLKTMMAYVADWDQTVRDANEIWFEAFTMQVIQLELMTSHRMGWFYGLMAGDASWRWWKYEEPKNNTRYCMKQNMKWWLTE